MHTDRHAFERDDAALATEREQLCRQLEYLRSALGLCYGYLKREPDTPAYIITAVERALERRPVLRKGGVPR